MNPPAASFDENATQNRRSQTVSTVKKSHARIPVACMPVLTASSAVLAVVVALLILPGR